MAQFLPQFAYCFMDQQLSQPCAVNLLMVVTVTLTPDESCHVATLADGSRRFFSKAQWSAISQRLPSTLGTP